jgi:hypothetical protein
MNSFLMVLIFIHATIHAVVAPTPVIDVNPDCLFVSLPLEM